MASNRASRNRSSDADSHSFITGWADTVTLLLVFFVYIISISSIDISKLFKATESFKRELNAQIDYERELVIPKLNQQLITYIEENQLQDYVSLESSINDIMLNFGDTLLFESGSADLTWRGQKVLKDISSQLNVSGILIRVEGHTDDIPISTEQFPSNWHLSTYRSAEVAGFLINNGVNPMIFEVVGFADTHPFVQGSTDSDRRKNRRVTILIKESYGKTNNGRIPQAVQGEV